MALTAAKATYPAGEEPKLQTLAQVFPKQFCEIEW